MSKVKPVKIQEDLENRILHGLSCEWDKVVWSLEYKYKCNFNKPFFSIKDMKNYLGQWSLNKREICLSRNLVLNHPWDAVCDVLRHEIAHQFADEIFQAWNEAPHGRSFKRACFILRADSKASGKYKTLHDRIMDDSASEEDKIVLKIKKLMALSESKNIHEAEAAMAKAHQLIAKYNIDLIKNNAKRNYVSIFIGKPSLRKTKDHYALSHLLLDFYFVKGIWTSAYVLDKNKMGRVLEISGTPKNVSIASYVHDFVRNYTNIKWGEYNKNKKLTLHRKVDFAIGIINGFSTKLKSQQSEYSTNASNDAYSIIKVEDVQLADYYKYRHPNIRSFRGKNTNHDENVMKAGIKLGKEMVISQGISNNGNNSRPLLK